MYLCCLSGFTRRSLVFCFLQVDFQVKRVAKVNSYRLAELDINGFKLRCFLKKGGAGGGGWGVKGEIQKGLKRLVKVKEF